MEESLGILDKRAEDYESREIALKVEMTPNKNYCINLKFRELKAKNKP